MSINGVSDEFIARLQTADLAIAWCVRVECTDGTIYRFTGHDQSLTVDSEVYLPAVVEPGAIDGTDTSSVQTFDAICTFSDDSMTSDDVLSGKFDSAEIKVFVVFWDDLSLGTMVIQSGMIGNITDKVTNFIAEFRSWSDLLQQPSVETTSYTCRYRLGDSNCGVNLSGVSFRGTVTSVTDRRNFVISLTFNTGYFTYGQIHFLSGSNENVKIEILSHSDGNAIQLINSVPYDIAVGDIFDITAGCNHYLGDNNGTLTQTSVIPTEATNVYPLGETQAEVALYTITINDSTYAGLVSVTNGSVTMTRIDNTDDLGENQYVSDGARIFFYSGDIGNTVVITYYSQGSVTSRGCKSFGNILNFGGEPYLPGSDATAYYATK